MSSSPEPNRQQLGERLGKGQFGVVHKALNLHTGQMVAIKTIYFEPSTPAVALDVRQEVELLIGLHHPCIVRYEGQMLQHSTLNIALE